ncbi:hypothetical protein MDA_GLEAN10015409 [Myotis davidii]|uniref:Uncharacterized protein n=1 Tax=Myotis davidii TaxID=225400 RepID=L5MIN5_MYODS|nr:hypothetical protein MDA_GLEAN10015409 [Myotis davidii]
MNTSWPKHSVWGAAAGDEALSSQVWRDGAQPGGPMRCAKRCGCRSASAATTDSTDRKMDAGLRLEMPNSTFVNGGKWEGSKESEFGSKGSNILVPPKPDFFISDSLPHELTATATKMEDVSKPTC